MDLNQCREGEKRHVERQRKIETECKSEVDEGSVTRQGLSGARGLGQCTERDELVCTLQGIV